MEIIIAWVMLGLFAAAAAATVLIMVVLFLAYIAKCGLQEFYIFRLGREGRRELKRKTEAKGQRYAPWYRRDFFLWLMVPFTGTAGGILVGVLPAWVTITVLLIYTAVCLGASAVAACVIKELGIQRWAWQEPLLSKPEKD